ncbi:MAG TPA: hypothetical protein VHY37_03315, partial [Tepidisphaeraceae bacterium]|nr:hypothetical protein [Tepidisphaeraceae bacterium]
PQVNAEGFRLLGVATPDDPHPIGIVEIPTLRTVIVTQLDGTKLTLAAGEMWRQKLQDAARYSQYAAEFLARQYFTYDAVAKRLGYKPVES